MRLHAFDDLPFHQGLLTADIPSTSDSHFNDGYWFAWYDVDHYFFAGMRLHPNNNVIDGYAGVVHAGEQRAIRVSRALRPAADELVVGPLALQVIEPMRTQRLTLAENESGLSFDVTLRAVSPPFLEEPHIQYRFGRLINHVLRYTGVCRASGTAVIDGRAVELDGLHSARDHSWGIRSSMGPHVPLGGIDPEPSDRDRRAMRLWVPFDVGEHNGFFTVEEDADGNVLELGGAIHGPGPAVREVVAVAHELRYHAGAARGRAGGGLASGRLAVTDSAGEELELDFEVCSGLSVQAFGYNRGWSDGGGPGVYRGALATECDRFAVADHTLVPAPAHVPASRRLGITEYAARARSAAGTGMAMVEHMIYGTYGPYGF